MPGDAGALLDLGQPGTEPDAGMDSGECLKHSMFRVDFRFRRGEVRKIVKKLPQIKYKKGIVSGRVSRYTYLNVE